MLLISILVSTALAAPCATRHEGQLDPSGPLLFEHSTGELVDSSDAVDSIVCAMGVDATLTLQVEAHTDSRGSAAYNLRVSQTRADAIRAALVLHGIAESRITAVGYGETMPLATNNSSSGRAQNRRIELHTTPPTSRPPAPIVKPHEPEPPIPVDPWCTELATAIRGDQATRWTRYSALTTVSQRMATCLQSGWQISWDGGEVYANHEQWRVAVQQRGDAVEVNLTRR